MTEIVFPYAEPPEFGTPREIAAGLYWLRLPLPFRLNHVNVYLIEEAAGWAVIDAGVDDAATRAIWEGLLGGLMAHKPLTRLIVTHYHPDHVGAAAYLCARTGARLDMDETEYLTARVHLLANAADTRNDTSFYREHGLGEEHLMGLAGRHERYRSMVPDLPAAFWPLRAGDHLTLGGRHVEVHCCGGHAPSQILLHAPDEGLLFAADHVLAQISPNVSVSEHKPEDDPLGLYLASFKRLTTLIPADVLVLAGHRLPFRGLHSRMKQLAEHHAERCSLILRACAEGAPLSVAEIVPILFPMPLDAHQFWFAFSEALAHVNNLGRLGQLNERRGADGVKRWVLGTSPQA